MAEYQIVQLEDVDDWLGDYPGEMRGITYAIGAEQVALTHRRMPQHTGSKGSYGHRHKTQEELYFVLSGKLLFKLNDEVVEVEMIDVYCWRMERLLQAGYCRAVACLLADNAAVDLHLACDLLASGCTERTAVQILA